jgi:hypothetical protein
LGNCSPSGTGSTIGHPSNIILTVALATLAGADIILSNHTDWDRSKVNLPLLAKRAPGDPNHTWSGMKPFEDI